YLDLNPEEIYARFCAQSGFAGAKVQQATGVGARFGRATGHSARDPALSRSHFATPVGRARTVGIGVSLSGLVSVAVVAGLVGGLGFGGWELLKDIQRVEFAPANDSPEVAEAPAGMALPALSISALGSTPGGRDAARDEALVALYAPLEPSPPVIELRDGPIMAIDPESAGVFARVAARPPAPAQVHIAAATPQNAAIPVIEAATPEQLAAAARMIAAAQAAPAPTGVWIVASESAWLRVKASDGSTLVQRIFQRGDRYELPRGLTGAEMRAGNAGAVYIEIDGRLHGPLGAPGGVAKNVSLDLDAVQGRYAVALNDPFAPKTPTARAEAQLTLD
ncbi:MAG: hypothetical protein ACJAVR_002115, partial [Paracoccaceae bacterium]